MQKIKTKIRHIHNLITQVCKNYNVPENGVEPIIRNYLGAEIQGKTTHGLSKFCFESQFFSEREGNPVIVVDTGPLIRVDGKKEVGPIAANFCTKLAIKRAKKYGVSFIGLNNIQRYGILGTWARGFSNAHVFGIVMNTCEPAMVGYKGNKKVLGTNPISFTIPTMDQNYVVDMATSKVAMSLIWQCLREQQLLPDDTFLDKNGLETNISNKAKAIKHFGGIKGYSIALLIQLLSGSVFGFKMGSRIKSMYDIGYVFLVIDQDKVTTHKTMLESNQKLIDELRKSDAVIPGSRSNNKSLSKFIEVNREILSELEKISKERKI